MNNDVSSIAINLNGLNDASTTFKLIFVITVIALLPSILIMMTSFVRFIISLYFVRSALGTQTMPPNQVLVGIALFLTFYIMSPVITQINENAITPYQAGTITSQEAINQGILPIKDFMLRQTRDEDIALFMNIADLPALEDDTQILNQIPLHVLVPAFIVNELRAGFIIGFCIYIPFIVVDMVVSSTLMAMGMMMLPPATISLPFKILLFVLCDGWNLIVGQLLNTFH